MRYPLLLMTSLAGSSAPGTVAFAHFALAGKEDAGNGLFWFYGLLLAGIAGFLIYWKWWGSKVSPERRALKRRLSELERALTSCMAQLQNAEDYPKECGLTYEQRLKQLQSVASFRGKIAKIKADLAES